MRGVRACFYFSQLSASSWPKWEERTRASLRPCEYTLFYAKLPSFCAKLCLIYVYSDRSNLLYDRFKANPDSK